ncbi:MAG TPA: rhomboid family intramembrane serine protease [Bryobacteraceae bacterium]|jgi:membrane associated rhomboid family serine protease
MAIGTRSYVRPYASGGGLPDGIRALLIINAALFLIEFFSRGALGGIFSVLALTPSEVVKSLYIWQLATFLFLHNGIWNILWNMLALWMFGKELEIMWGTRRFLRFYFLCGCGAGVCVVLAEYLAGNPNAPTIGSSASIYGILAASAALWPEREILFIFFPMKMKYFVILIGAIDFLISYNAGIGQIALLTGLVFGLLYVKSPRVRGFDPLASVESSYRAWKLRRAKRKFQVYLRKHGSDRDVN